jgi:hypothetical protein
MPKPGVLTRSWLGGFILVLVVLFLVVDGSVSKSEAADRWVGTAVISASGTTIPVDFIVLVNPGVSASWEWKYFGVHVLGGALAATVNGSRVTGTLFTSDALVAPCNFSGTINGNHVDGTFDSNSCGGNGTFFLNKK